MRRFKTLGFLAVAGLSIASSVYAAEPTKLSLAEVKKQVDGGKAVLVDVREASEWNAGHVEGAVFLPLSAVQDGLSKEELAKLPKDKTLYVHCVVGKRALTAANVFEKHGFRAESVKPGYKELISAGFPAAQD